MVHFQQSSPVALTCPYETADTAGGLVRLRETSAVCMRLGEEEEAGDRTPLMLMREL